MLRHWLFWSSIAAGIALALWLRWGWIESAATANRCLDGLDSIGCLARGLAVTAFTSGALGMVAVGCALLALAWKHPFSAWLAVLVGGVAMVLYSAEAGAASLLVGSLRMVRLGSARRAEPGGEDGRGEQGVAQQP